MCRGLIIMIISLSLSSCQQQRAYHHDDTEMINVLNRDNPIQIDLYDIVDSVKYTFLETNKCLLSDIECIKRDESFYFIKDSRGIFVFDINGHYVSEISHRGVGPEEYDYADNFYLDRDNKLVCIICNAEKKILQYTYTGTYFNTIRIDAKDANIEFIMKCKSGEHIAYYPLPNDYTKSENEYSVFKVKDNSLSGEMLLKAKDVNTQNEHYPFLHYPIALFDNQYYLISVLSNELLVYDQSKIVSKYYVNIPKNEPSISFLEDHKDLNFFDLIKTLKENHIGLGITAIESSSDYLFMSISNQYVLIWDKEQSILISGVYDSNLRLYSDLLLPGGVSEEHLGFYETDFLCSNKDLILKSKDKSLARLIETFSEDDNPIVFQYYFKENAINKLKEKYGI